MTEGSEQTTQFDPPTVPVTVGEATRPIEIERTRLSASQVALVFASVALAAFLAGIGVGVATRQDGGETVVASKVIGPRGGVVRFERGQLDFPPRAVGRNTRIVVYRSTFDDRITVRGTDIDTQRFQPGGLVAFRFEPSAVTFQRPVRLVFRLDDGSRNAALFARSNDEIILLSGKIDTARDVATTEIRNFRFERGGRR